MLPMKYVNYTKDIDFFSIKAIYLQPIRHSVYSKVYQNFIDKWDTHLTVAEIVTSPTLPTTTTIT